MGGSPDHTRPSTRVASGPAYGGCIPPGGVGHDCGPDGGGGPDGGAGRTAEAGRTAAAARRGAYHESQGVDSGCGGGAAAGDVSGGHADGGVAGTAGNGAVNGWDSAAPLVAGCPQTGQNRASGCTECPHAQLPEPVTPAIVTAG